MPSVAGLVHSAEQFTAPWASLYGASVPLENGVMAAHVLSMLAAAGLAVAFDRGTLRAARWNTAERTHHLHELHAVHPAIVVMLAVCFASGIALFAADVKTFALSLAFWIKMGLIALLLVNALVMTATERRLRTFGGESGAAWTRLQGFSIASAVLWFAVAFFGVVLSNSK
jgi:hypothetical protein